MNLLILRVTKKITEFLNIITGKTNNISFSPRLRLRSALRVFTMPCLKGSHDTTDDFQVREKVLNFCFLVKSYKIITQYYCSNLAKSFNFLN